MKRIILTILVLTLLAGCKKDKSGHVNYNIRYTQSNEIISKAKLIGTKSSMDNEKLYTQFGDYITSLTPSKFTGKFNVTSVL